MEKLTEAELAALPGWVQNRYKFLIDGHWIVEWEFRLMHDLARALVRIKELEKERDEQVDG